MNYIFYKKLLFNNKILVNNQLNFRNIELNLNLQIYNYF